MPARLISWIGTADLKGPAAIHELLSQSDWPITSAEILFNKEVFQKAAEEGAGKYQSNLEYEQHLKVEFKQIQFRFHEFDILNPTDYPAVFEASEKVFRSVVSINDEAFIIINSTSGTPTMHSVWMLLASSGVSHDPRVKVLQAGKDGAITVTNLSKFVDIWARILPSISAQSEASFKSKIPVSQELEDLFLLRSKSDSEFRKLNNWIANSRDPVVIYGESGVGKEKIASAIARHWIGEDLMEEKFVAVNCAGLSNELLEVELFGSEEGAFTGAKNKIGLIEQAEDGVLFLDELGELPLPCQAKLLRALQEKKIRKVGGVDENNVNFLLICATNRDLREFIREKRFREDLFYRVANFEFVVPPLRQRRDEIEHISRQILDSIDAGGDKELTPEFVKLAMAHNWPGNIRELQILIRRACVSAASRGSKELEEIDFKQSVMKPIAIKRDSADDSLPPNLADYLSEIEYRIMSKAIAEAGTAKLAWKIIGYSSESTFNRTFTKLKKKFENDQK